MNALVLRGKQQVGLPGNWKCLSGVIAVLDIDAELVAYGVADDVVAVPPGYAIEALVPGSSISRSDESPDPNVHYEFVVMRSKRKIPERVRMVQQRLGGRWLRPTVMSRIIGCCRESAGRAYAWRSAVDGG